MQKRLGPDGLSRATLTIRLPIDRLSRERVDQETERLRHCVIPIIGEDDGRPFLVGSAVAVCYRNRAFLVTAHHVVKDGTTPLGFFASDGCSRELRGPFGVSESDDLAVKLLSDDETDALAHIPFLTERDFAVADDLTDRFYASVAGYPATAAKRRAKKVLETPMEIFSDFAEVGKDNRISVRMDKRQGARGDIGHTIPRNPYGKSGGAIFAMRTFAREILPEQTAKFAGILVEWHRDDKRQIGVGLPALIPLLDYTLENPRAA